MDINKTIDGDTHELVVSGRIDGEGANQLEVALISTIAAGAKTIYVELDQATFLCSAGLRTLLQYWRQMNNKQRTLQVTSPSPEVASVLATSGFRDMLVRKM
jgi:anti-anti-sigma factor